MSDRKAERVGRNINEVLHELGWTQLRLSKKADITAAHLNKIIQGRVMPRATTLQIIADALGVPIARLTVGECDLTFAARLCAARDRAKLSQEELAEKVGVHFASISNYETGKSIPTSFILKCLCEVLEVSADWLLGLKSFDVLIPEKET